MENEDAKMRRLQQLAAADQGLAGAADLGRMASTLYTGFVAGGIPVRLADTMVRDWFYLQMHRALWGPSMAPSPPFWSIEHDDKEGEL